MTEHEGDGNNVRTLLCPMCGGAEKVASLHDDPGGTFALPSIEDCYACGGSGRLPVLSLRAFDAAPEDG